MHQYLDLGNGIIIPLYNLLIGIGAIFGLLFLEKELKSAGFSFSQEFRLFPILIVSVLTGFAGARIAEMLYHQLPFTWNSFLQAGLTFMAGLALAGVVFILSSYLFKLPVLKSIDLLIPLVLLAHAFGRIGCFLAGCCYGGPTDLFWGVSYPEGSLPALEYGTQMHLHPTQLYESAYLFILFYIIAFRISIYFRLPMYLLSYGLFRFLVEFLRVDDRGQILGTFLSPSQWFSLIFIAMGVYAYFAVRHRYLEESLVFPVSRH